MKRVKTLVDDEDDKFNTLHVDLLLHIINFLPTKDALRTCVLSSRWRYLWRCISNIDLTFYNSRGNCSLFLDLIDKLLVHRGSSDIKRFSVVCLGAFFDGARIHRWISEVINHNVQELRIHYHMDAYIKPPCLLPLCLFKSQSLTVLEIDLNITFGSESSLFSVHLPSLKILKLMAVSFLNNYTVQHFFSNTPKLQHLCLLGCGWGEAINRLIIDIPTLERLEVVIFGHRAAHGCCEVTVNAPNLTYFNCVTNFAIDFLISNHSLSLDVYLEPHFVEDGGRRAALVRLLESFKRTRVLHVTWDFTKWLRTEDMPFLTNLRELVISPGSFCARGDINLEKVFMLLHKIPNLQSLAITLTKCCPTKCCTIHPLLHVEYDDRPPSGGVPSCVVYQIKKVSISNSFLCFYDTRARDYSTAMSSIKYFMNHSRSLKILNVDWYRYSHMVQEITDETKRHTRFSDFKNVVSIRYHTERKTKADVIDQWVTRCDY